VIILDSDHLSIHQSKRGSEYAVLESRLAAFPETDVFTTIISFHEQIGGWYKSLARPRKQRDVVFAYQMLERVITNFSEMQVVPFEDSAAAEFRVAQETPGAHRHDGSANSLHRSCQQHDPTHSQHCRFRARPQTKIRRLDTAGEAVAFAAPC